MKKHKDLISVLRSNKMRITPARRHLLQFILDNASRRVSLREIQEYVSRHSGGMDRTSLYRNLVSLKKLDIIQELNLPGQGKRFEYVFDRKVHHYYICKACGKASRGNERLFARIEKALKDVHGFSKANLSMIFYGRCSRCQPEASRI